MPSRPADSRVRARRAPRAAPTSLGGGTARGPCAARSAPSPPRRCSRCCPPRAGRTTRRPPARASPPAARGLPWRAVPPAAPPPPLSRTWTFDGDDPAWTVEEPGRGSVEDGHLVAFSLDSVALVGPSRGHIDPELQQWLVVEVLPSSDAATLTVQWRGPGDAFAEERQTSPLPLAPPKQGVQRLAVPLSTLRATHNGRDASEGVEAFRLVFAGPPGSRPRVRVDAIHLVSDYDAAPDRLLAQGRPARRGEARDGLALRLPAALEAEVVPAPGERLRLGLALAGCAHALGVTLRATSGADASETRVELQPGADWHDVRLDLAPFAGRPTTLALAADALASDASDADATLFVGGVLRLQPDVDARPNLLLYVEDTLRADRLSSDGWPFDTDPHLRVVADAGTRFAHVVSASCWTRPATSSLLTSLEPPSHGNTTHLRRISDDALTLAEALAAEGWLTVSFVTNYHAGAWSGLDQGFDQAREPTADGAGRIASTLTSSAVEPSIEAFLAEHRDERVFVYVHSLDPHEPYEPDQEDLDALLPTRAQRPPLSAPRVGDLADDSLRYDAEIRHNDRSLARLDEVLERLALRDATLFAFTSDHGEAFGEHGQVHHRRSLFQEELAVPLVLRGPHVPEGRVLDAEAGLLDLAPTLLGLLGAPVPDVWQGRDLSPLVRGERERERPVPLLSHVIYDEPRAGHLEELAVLQDGRKLLAAVTVDGTLVPRALYDLRSDPGETLDLLADADAEARAVADALLAFARERLAAGRSAASAAEAEPMDPALREWMAQMGYLQDGPGK
ncbi:MAG: sulfatase-like hydrolase/transferase [Planctomycetes bacterium]|nr:sulfatase-like hydrolase/transferase [Planctomycetota bacterium]